MVDPQIRGLEFILGDTGATMHTMAMPPTRDEFDTDEEHELAVEKWYDEHRPGFWRSYSVPLANIQGPDAG